MRFFPLGAALVFGASALLGAAPTDPTTAPDTPAVVRIVGRRELADVFTRLSAVATTHDPAVHYAYVPANDLAALQSLAYGTTPFALVGCEFLSAVSGPQRILVGAEPFGIKIAHASPNPTAAVSPLAIIVHPDNPLSALSLGQVARIFTVGTRQPALTHWRQIGVNRGRFAGAQIHPYGLAESDHYPSEDESFAEYLFFGKFQGAPATLGYIRTATYADVVSRVAADPLGIGITALNRVDRRVKVVALSSGDWAKPSLGSEADLRAGRYPLDRYLYVYVRRERNAPIEPASLAFLRAALSPEGQAALAHGADGYLPLSETERDEELEKLGIAPSARRASVLQTPRSSPSRCLQDRRPTTAVR